MKKLSVLLSIFIFVSMLSIPFAMAISDEDSTETTFYTTASRLNGRANPRKTARVEASFDRGDIVYATGKWSKDYRWIEVHGGETGTVWVKISYVTERKDNFFVCNEDYKKVKVRKRPIQGNVVAYIKKGERIKITQVVLGWGKCSKGWVDLDYFVEVP